MLQLARGCVVKASATSHICKLVHTAILVDRCIRNSGSLIRTARRPHRRDANLSCGALLGALAGLNVCFIRVSFTLNRVPHKQNC